LREIVAADLESFAERKEGPGAILGIHFLNISADYCRNSAKDSSFEVIVLAQSP